MKKGIIIGAGIGGLTTAIALAQKGFDITVYEQAPQLNEVGAGVWLAPNGLKVLERLGIVDEFLKIGHELELITIKDTSDKNITYIDGKEIRKRHNYTTLAIHRAKLQKQLATHIPDERLILNKKCIDYSQSSNQVHLTFQDNTSETADFVIFADGIHSVARKKMNGELNLRYSGQTCWRFILDNYKLPEDQKDKMYEIWSDKKGLRAAYSQLNENQVYCYITNFIKPGLQDNKSSIKNDLLELCSDFQPLVKKLISDCDENIIIRSDLFDFKPINNWIDQNILLLGDAAHATTPNLGQGACQAIEDALVLANELNSSDSINSAYNKFQKRRIEKAHYVTNTSFKFAQVNNTTGIVKKMMKFFIRNTPSSVNNKQFDKLYYIDSEKK